MSFFNIYSTLFLGLLVSINSFAVCDMPESKYDLEKGYNISLDSSCPIKTIKELSAIGKEKVTVRLLAFSPEEAYEVASTGVLLKYVQGAFSFNVLLKLATQNSYRLTANLGGLTLSEAKNIAITGTNIKLDSTFSPREIKEICQKVQAPAAGSVYTRGFSGADLLEISESGCSIVDVGEGSMNFFEVEKILSSNGRIEIDSHITGVRAKELASLGRERLTVELGGFALQDARKIAENGANVNLNHNISGHEAEIICHLIKSPAIGRVNKKGFSEYDLKKIIEAGCAVFY